MLDLKRRAPDMRRFVASIEEWIIRSLEGAFGVCGGRREDRVGVWVARPDKGEGAGTRSPLSACRVQRWVTLRGTFTQCRAEPVALYRGIVPCGVRRAEVRRA